MHAEHKVRAVSLALRVTIDRTSSIVYNLLANEQAHAYPFTINAGLCLVFLQFAKEREKLVYLSVADTSASVNYVNYKSLVKGIEADLDLDR